MEKVLYAANELTGLIGVTQKSCQRGRFPLTAFFAESFFIGRSPAGMPAGDRFAYGVWDVRPARSQSTLFST